MARKRLSARDLRARRARELTRALDEKIRLCETFARDARRTLKDLTILLSEMDLPEPEKEGSKEGSEKASKEASKEVEKRVKNDPETRAKNTPENTEENSP